LPSGDGSPYADFAQPLADATRSCRGVVSVTAELGLSGRGGRMKLRGRAVVGAAVPDRIRLEALAPFGPPVFILAAHDGRATLLLPRDDRVLSDARPDEIVEALTGVPIDPSSLRSALVGCGVLLEHPVSARSYGGEWLRIDDGAGQVVFLQMVNGGWRVRGARTSAFSLTYDELGPAQPLRMTLHSAGRAAAEIRLRLSQVEIDAALGPEAFEVQVPADAAPLTLQELRDSGPLGEGK
jgi:hypothetical protein